MSSHELLVFDFEQGAPAYTVHEVCEICEVTVARLVSFVEFGVLEPEPMNLDENVEGNAEGNLDGNLDNWRFPAHAILKARRAYRLQRDLELDLPGLALALELLEEIDVLRREVQHLRAQVAQFTQP